MDLRRKDSLRYWTFCFSLLVFGAIAGPSFATSGFVDPNKPQETNRRRELTDRLEELIRQLRQERSTYYVQKARHEERIEKVRQNRKILQDEIDDLRRQEAELDQQLQKYKAEVEDLKRQLVSREFLENVLREQIQPFLVNQKTAIKVGIPYKQQERIARLDAALGDVNAPSRISAADHLGHIWNYSQEELRLARSSETYTARAKIKDDSSPYARFFRVGQKILGYVTEDGQQVAMWLPLPQHKDWLFITDKKQLGQIHSAVEILDRRQASKLVALPILLQTTSANEGDSDVSP